MSNSSIRYTTPVEESDFEYLPMHSDYRPQHCKHVGCVNSATNVRYKKDINGGRDKSSKTFTCDEHKLTTNL